MELDVGVGLGVDGSLRSPGLISVTLFLISSALALTVSRIVPSWPNTLKPPGAIPPPAANPCPSIPLVATLLRISSILLLIFSNIVSTSLSNAS